MYEIIIERGKELTFPGVIINWKKLCSKQQINHIKTKMAKSIAILYKTKYIFNQNSLYTWYCFFKVGWGGGYIQNER